MEEEVQSGIKSDIAASNGLSLKSNRGSCLQGYCGLIVNLMEDAEYEVV